MIDFFSRRRKAIETRFSELLRAYPAQHGREPTTPACHQLARQGKKPPGSLTDKRRDELTAAFGLVRRRHGDERRPIGRAGHRGGRSGRTRSRPSCHDDG